MKTTIYIRYVEVEKQPFKVVPLIYIDLKNQLLSIHSLCGE